MKLNEAVLKDLFSHSPEIETCRYVFLVDDEKIESQIIYDGYMVVGITDDESKDIFLRLMNECQFSWMKDFYFIPSTKFGLIGEVQKELNAMGFNVLSTGWKIFWNKEDYFKTNPKELAPALSTYIASVSRTASGRLEPQPAAISAAELMQMEIEPINWIVTDMLAPGLSMVAGASKLGKSWWSLQLCVSVALGMPFMGKATKKTKVLYLSLEDSRRRIQNRLKRQLQNGYAPDGLYFVTDAHPLHNGLLDQLEPFVKDGVELIVIDTLQKVRGTSGNKNAYSADYDDMGVLKKFADKNNISILLVHHTSKKKDDDVFNTVNGTTGIMGAADTAMILTKEKRSETKALLHITGRDVYTDTWEIDFDRSTCTWSNLGSKEDLDKQLEDFNYRHDPITETIKYLVDTYGGWYGPAAEFQNKMMERGHGYQEVRSIGKRFREIKRQLYEIDQIIYEEPENTKQKFHKFRRMPLKLDFNDTHDTNDTEPP